MGLFQKKQISNTAPLYRIGASRSLLVVGLGNPGKEYEGTRHNVGFTVLDQLAKNSNFQGWVNKKDQKCIVNTGEIAGTKLVLCKPQTFMNLSGQAASKTQRYFRIINADTLVVYDELAIPFGQIRTRTGGSDAGHNGVKSLIEYLGEDFIRLRVGIGKDNIIDNAAFVLKKFSSAENKHLPQIINEAVSIIGEFSTGNGLSSETRKVI